MLYTVEKASNNRIYIEATVLSAGVAYEHFFATSSGGSITWRRYAEITSSDVFVNLITTSPGANALNVPSGSRHIFASVDSDQNRCGLYLVWETGAGNVGYVTIQSASGLTITTTTNTLSINTGTGTPVLFDIYAVGKITHN